MTKKHFIALADMIKQHNSFVPENERFTECQLDTLADFCVSQNANFMESRWLAYIKGECGKNGGRAK